ncbi:GNAT family N-acetyltransferase [Flavobacterium sp. NPDC079362]|uniref:GNAT family N-acetyltransferase n=1 Tax=Flavobacterium sp. NPDC079362 TaxID=3390566 RepID=UPI003D02AB90
MIRLEKFDTKDYSQLINSIKDARELMQFAGPEFTFPLTEEQIERSLSDKNRIAFRVVNVSNDSTIGHCQICFKDKFANLGRILIMDELLRGKGIGKQILTLLLEFILENSKQRNVELNVFDFNTSAIKCYEKIGFVINRDKKFVREMDSETWTALNMQLDLDNWIRKD